MNGMNPTAADPLDPQEPDLYYSDHIIKVHELQRLCESDSQHAEHVRFLALSLFDQLDSVTQLPRIARDWLEFAAILHDIGWVQGHKEHHKKALETILNTPLLEFNNKERLIVGSIARYHRKALPNKTHDHYAALSNQEQKWVRSLSGVLRLANAMDTSHFGIIQSLDVKIKNKKVMILCVATRDPSLEIKKAKKHRILLENEIHKKIKFNWSMASPVLE